MISKVKVVGLHRDSTNSRKIQSYDNVWTLNSEEIGTGNEGAKVVAVVEAFFSFTRFSKWIKMNSKPMKDSVEEDERSQHDVTRSQRTHISSIFQELPQGFAEGRQLFPPRVPPRRPILPPRAPLVNMQLGMVVTMRRVNVPQEHNEDDPLPLNVAVFRPLDQGQQVVHQDEEQILHECIPEELK